MSTVKVAVRTLIIAALLTWSDLAAPAGAQPKGCQNQLCAWGGQCYQCATAYGYYCSPKLETCPKQCTEGVCGSGAGDSCGTDIQGAADAFQLNIAQQNQSQSRSTITMMLPQPTDPVSLTEVTHTMDRVVLSAQVRNATSEPLVSVRLGRIVVYRNDVNLAPETRVGDPTIFSAPVRGGGNAGFVEDQPGLGRVHDLHRSGALRVVVFVAEAEFTSGRRWTADLTGIERLALGQK